MHLAEMAIISSQEESLVISCTTIIIIALYNLFELDETVWQNLDSTLLAAQLDSYWAQLRLANTDIPGKSMLLNTNDHSKNSN